MIPSPQPNSDNIPNNHHASIHSARAALEKFIHSGCHPSKLVMGIPAYGRHEKNIGLVRTYSEVIDDMVRDYDDNSADIKTTIRSIRSWDGYVFDSPDDVREKVNYATQMGLGGIFIWELGQDKQLAGIAEGGILLEEAAAAAANSLVISDDVPKDEL
jgi:GH18 family chitinase